MSTARRLAIERPSVRISTKGPRAGRFLSSFPSLVLGPNDQQRATRTSCPREQNTEETADETGDPKNQK